MLLNITAKVNNFFKKYMLRSKKEGFTLIELIVVVSILVGLATMISINSTTARKQSSLSRGVSVVKSNLVYTQSIGMNGKPFPENSTFSQSENFDRGYGIHFVKDGTSIIIYGGKGDVDGSGDIDSDEETYSTSNNYKIINLPGRVKIDSIRITNPGINVQKNNVDILFRRGSSQAHIHGPGFTNAGTVKITLKNGSFIGCITVNKTGLIYDSC